MRYTHALFQQVLPWERRAAAEPGAAMFARLRNHLTLWYTGVLFGMLVLFGALLYAGVHQLLFQPINSQLATGADQLARYWQTHPGRGCPTGTALLATQTVPASSAPGTVIVNGQILLIACFDASGQLLSDHGQPMSDPGAAIPALQPFLENSLVQTALQQGTATDSVNGGSLGDIYRYAEVVPSPTGDGMLGVVQVGEPVGTQQMVMRLLLTLLLILGGLTLLGAAGGGLFLARRALEPARLAFARQQAFIADASHELRTPLTLLRTDAEVLLRGRERLTPDDAALVEDMLTEAQHMSALANNLLLLARLDAGAFHPEREVVDLAEIAASVARRVQALASQQQLSLHLALAGSALVIGDRTLLEQAALILVENAIKYNRPGGSVTIAAAAIQGQARLEVRDTGIGIAAQHLPHLGERFYRVDKARSREAGGAGLGLSIARSIAAAHQGTLALASAPGQGTTAALILPAATQR